jgi:cytochrome c553
MRQLFVTLQSMLMLLLAAQMPVSASDLSADGLPYDHGSLFVSPADATDGEKLYQDNGCMECHGPRGVSPDPDMFPRIAGLDQQYIIDRLTAFRSGSRQNVIMSPIAARLSDADIRALAAYISARKQ